MHPTSVQQVQLEKLTEQFQTVTEDMRRRFAVDGEPMVNAGHVSASSPLAMAASPLRAASVGFFRQTGFTPPQQSRPGMAASGDPWVWCLPWSMSRAAHTASMACISWDRDLVYICSTRSTAFGNN